MKKLTVILLALLLCGCAANTGNDAAQEQPSETVESGASLVSLYDADSEAEVQTDGAVRAYLLGDGVYTALLPFGEKLLVVSDSGDITLLQGENGEIAETVATDLSAAWGTADLCAGKQTVGYYAEATREVVILDEQLQRISRILMPEEMQGKPLIQLDRGEIFYCTTGEVRAVNIQSGLSRLLRSHSCTSQELVGSLFDGAVLSCMVVDAQGVQSVLYLDTETGRQIDEDLALGKVYSYGQRYYALRTQADAQQLLFGTRDGETMSLDISAENVYPVLAMNGALSCAVSESGLELAFYDLSAGKNTAAVTIPTQETLKAVTASESYVWILAGQTLYRWDTAASAVSDDTVYTSQLYTKENPDTEGLAQCQERADQLAQTYGFTLHIWEDAKTSGKNYGAEAEYQVSAINSALDRVEEVLSKLPEDFLTTTGDVRVSLVRSLSDGANCAQFWAGGAYHLILAGEDVTDSLLWGLGNAVDTRVLGNSFDYDTWEKLNPWWFDYTYDYAENLERNNPEDCLDGDNRYFTDVVAMSFPTEDRSRLFANAMMDDNAEMFESSAMQKKLKCICVAIREAYGWEDSTEIFTWEQYLNDPIAADD